MNYDIPKNSGEKKVEAPKALKEFLWTSGKFEATLEEVEEFNRLLSLPLEELDGKDGVRYNLTAQAEEFGIRSLVTIEPDLREVENLYAEIYRKLAVCQAAINTKKNNT